MWAARTSARRTSRARGGAPARTAGAGECAEAGRGASHLVPVPVPVPVPVRDSKRPSGHVIAFGADARRTFIGVLG
ncbi:DUF397 domain-containing protein [Streptomyces sp. NPDC088726]|uniref:DUF397 domain-containing protein n=1 Tax=Streptomyces sp. NPDC088726 TaxID=3365874 RepID=UPI00382541BE